MNTDVNIYNIIWADDECFTLKNDENIRIMFDDRGIEVLEYVPTSEELRKALDNYKDKVDAVVIDGNFSRDNSASIAPNDISGLVHSLSLIEVYNIKRDIPFFLYTGKKQMLQEICTNGELQYFNSNERIFQKGHLQELVEAIIHDIDHIQTIEFRVKKKYRNILKFAESIDKVCSDNLYDFLLNEARDITFKRTELMFNDLRNILEKIVTFCIDLEITPEEVKTLNNFKHYWNGKLDWIDWDSATQCPKTYKNYVLMPKVISSTLWSFIDILQDGSHSTEDLKLFVREYVTDTKRPFLFRTCLYQTLDILRWYADIERKIEAGFLVPPLFKDKT